jgi:hypothetical protein
MAKSATAAKVIPIQPKAVRKAKKAPIARVSNTKTVEKPPVWQRGVTWKVSNLLDAINKKVLQHIPVSNRASTVDSGANEKNVGIINSILKHFGINTLVLRNIAKSMRHIKLYGQSYKYLVIDGGHRCRAIKWFINGKFAIKIGNQKFFWKDLPDDVRQQFLDFDITVEIVECNNNQARQIFENMNKTTQVGSYSLIMSDEESKITEFVRKQTKDWTEYRSQCHEIFRVDKDDNPIHIRKKGGPNAENLWDTMVFYVIHKVIGKGNVLASEVATKKLIDQYGIDCELPKSVQKDVIAFFDLLLEVRLETKSLLTFNYFCAFQTVYFQLWEDARNTGKSKVQIDDVAEFATKFHLAFTELTDKANTDTEEVDGELLKVNAYVINASKAVAYPELQTHAATLIMEHMSNQ